MLKKCNDAWLLDLHVPEKYLFFYQVWGEVTEPRTLSTYQYRLMNTLSILSELLDILSMAQQNIYAVGKELEACLGEARSIIEQDFVLKERCPKPLKVLQSALSQNPKGRNDYLKLTAQLEAFLRGMEHQYLEILLEYLKDQLAGGTDRDSKKKHMIWLTKQIVSVYLSQGKEISVLKKAHHVLQKEKDSQEDEWQAFANILRDQVNVLLIFRVFNNVLVLPRDVLEKEGFIWMFLEHPLMFVRHPGSSFLQAERDSGIDASSS